MRAAVKPGALIVAALTVPVACGAARQPTQLPSTNEHSVRFRDVTFYIVEGEKREEAIVGAFDWAKREGWTEERYRGSIGYTRQVGDDCFSRHGNDDWNHRRAGGNPPLCDPDLFQPPAELLEDVRSHGRLEPIGEEAIRGVMTTRFRFVPGDDFADEPDAWLEIWLDENDVVYRLRRPAGEASPRVRDYSDFGVDAHVTWPCRPVRAASAPSTTLAQQDRKLKPCVEEGS